VNRHSSSLWEGRLVHQYIVALPFGFVSLFQVPSISKPSEKKAHLSSFSAFRVLGSRRFQILLVCIRLSMCLRISLIRASLPWCFTITSLRLRKMCINRFSLLTRRRRRTTVYSIISRRRGSMSLIGPATRLRGKVEEMGTLSFDVSR
jgi:hypothetical protein